MKLGDYLCLTHFRYKDQEPPLWARVVTPAWRGVSLERHQRIDLLCGGNPDGLLQTTPWRDDPTGWVLGEDASYTIYAEDQLPDDYWRAMALEALTS